MKKATGHLLKQLERIATSLEALSPPFELNRIHWDALAYRWEHINVHGRSTVGCLVPIQEPNLICFNQLHNVDQQRQLIEQNTRQFVMGLPANNILLTGARGTGKSSLVRACLDAFYAQGLRLIEVEKDHLNDLPGIVDRVRSRAERFIVFCDDLSFEEGETGYKGLKTVLDGSLSGASSNVLVYATSNRRHLVPEYESNNLSYHHSEDGELHPGDVIEEKISLSDRFGLWISFLSFTQDQYLLAVQEWLHALEGERAFTPEVRQEALQWALQRGSRSGRIAWQFARDYVGRKKLSALKN